MGGQQSPPDNRAAGFGLGHSGPPWSPRPRCRGCSRAPPGPAWAPEVSGARLPAVTPYCLGAAAASPQPSCRWASLRFRLLPAGACTSVSLQADTGASIQSSGLQLAPPLPPSLLVSAGKGDVWPGLPCCPDPQAGAESLSRSSPLHTWNSSACLPDRAVSEAVRLGLAAVGPRRLTPSHQGGVDFPETAGGGGGGGGGDNHLGTSGSQSLSEHHLLTYLETRVFENQMHF